jgi:hypothetical protein
MSRVTDSQKVNLGPPEPGEDSFRWLHHKQHRPSPLCYSLFTNGTWGCTRSYTYYSVFPLHAFKYVKLTCFCRSIICILGGGLAAGLTIGLMSLDNGMFIVLIFHISYFIFHVSCFIFHISYFIFHISYFIFPNRCVQSSWSYWLKVVIQKKLHMPRN